MIKTFDAIVIGAGQAGPSLAGRLTVTMTQRPSGVMQTILAGLTIFSD
jgi:cation diffusion facilitator CzcD-associated flavoprotein CzcO